MKRKFFPNGCCQKYLKTMLFKKILKNKNAKILAFLTLHTIGLSFLSCVKKEKAKENETSDLPNIIVIFADDMGYGDLSCLNDSSAIQTENIDRLAQQGMIFTDAHSSSSVSTPSRYGLLTGRYSFRTTLKRSVLIGLSPSLIEPGRETLATLLSKNGYETACIGKWHLGLDFQKKDKTKPLFEGNNWDIQNTENVDYFADVHGGPTEHGFDYSYILPASLDIQPYVFISNKKVVNTDVEHIEAVQKQKGYFWRHGDASKDFNFEQVLPLLTRKATDFISKKHNKPFFLYFPLTAPHTPWLPLDKYKGKSDAGNYGDFVLQVDDVVGCVINVVDSLGIANNTLIIIASDNGAFWKQEDIEKYNHKANYVFSGMKSDLWEGGHRLPFIIRWPEKVKAGSQSKQMVSFVDLFATFAEIINNENPYNTAEDSYSFYSVLTGEKQKTPLRTDFIMHSDNGEFAIRKDNWKYIDCKGSGGWSSPGNENGPPGQLYNLDNDISETKNLYNEFPEKVEELKNLLEMYKKEGRSR